MKYFDAEAVDYYLIFFDTKVYPDEEYV